ncbi:MAG: lytic transglycosylase domain-containing protein [bacterium]|nr:lytic transglycosylase domain-containing protein [bacterium]
MARNRFHARMSGTLRLLLTGIFIVWTHDASALDLPPLPSLKPAAPANVSAVPLPGVRPEAPERDPWRILDDVDQETYRRIFAVQERADWREADRLITRLRDPVLMGHVLAQRYLHPTGWISSFDELRTWLDSWADHPDARRIHALALRRQPTGAAAPAPPVRRWGEPDIAAVTIATGSSVLSSADPDSGLNAGEHDFLKQVRRDVRNGRLGVAWSRLADTEALAGAGLLAIDMAAAEIAFGYFIHGDDAVALDIATTALYRSGQQVPLAGWTAGLAAWRSGRPHTARSMMLVASQGDPANPLVAASAWWAARLSLLTGEPGDIGHLLGIAAHRPYTLYGLLARHALGMDEDLVNDPLPQVSDEGLRTLSKIPAMRRALALAEVGQYHRGDRELRGLGVRRHPAASSAIMAMAARMPFPATRYRLSREFLTLHAARLDDALFPLPPWEPEGGFTIEPALMYALMRQESHFRARTVSRVGARGILQIMPATAAWIAGDSSLAGAGRYRLDDPGVSVDLGERYVRYLLDLPDIDGSLFLVLAAYNGGPARLARRLNDSGPLADPLLFVESYPSRETRSFLRDVMADYWIYTRRLGYQPASLAALAAGGWPLYGGS